MVVSRIDRPLSDWANSPSSLPSKRLVDRPSRSSDACLPLRLPRRPVRRPGRPRHRRRLGHRPLHRARAGVARRAGGDRRPHAGKARGGEARDRGRRRTLLGARRRHPRRGRGAGDGGGGARGPRPDRCPGEQRRRPVPLAAGGDQRQGLGRGGAQQPHRRLPDGARVHHPVDARGRRQRRAARRAIVNIIADMWNGMPGMGHSGAARAGMLNFTETAALEWAPVRVNAVAPGWIASSGLDRYPPEMRRPSAACMRCVPLAPARHRERGRGGDRLPALAGGGVRLRQLPARRRRGAERASGSGPRSAPAARPRRSTAFISPRRPTC